MSANLESRLSATLAAAAKARAASDNLRRATRENVLALRVTAAELRSAREEARSLMSHLTSVRTR